MNKTHAAAWDGVAEHALAQGAELVRTGHRFTYRYDRNGLRVDLWAEENIPRFGVRVGDLGARVWTMEAVAALVDSLVAHPPGPLWETEPETAPSKAR